jgi:transposase
MKTKLETIIRGYKVKLYPTSDQVKTLDLWCSHTRGLWNALLGLEIKTYNKKKVWLWQKDLNEIVNSLKKDPEMQWLCDLPAHAVQFVINTLCSALKGSSKKSKNRKGFPKFKKKHWGVGAVYMVNTLTQFFEGQHKVKLSKIGLVKYRGSGFLVGRLVCSKIIKDGNN